MGQIRDEIYDELYVTEKPMRDRYYELVNNLKHEHGVWPAKRLAKKQYIKELLDKAHLYSADRKADITLEILYMMNEVE